MRDFRFSTVARAAVLSACFVPLVALSNTQAPGHFKLKNSLDRPVDGYCLDVVGSGRYIRFDMPLTAHNCKGPQLYRDEAVIIEGSKIKFPAYGACATVAGINGRALPGAALVPRQCGERSPFMEAENLQRFTFHPDGGVELAGSGLCMTVSDQSDSTFEPAHRWRPLYMARCSEVDPSRSQWEFVEYIPRSGVDG